MKTVHEVSEVSGVSVRALHHYDAIGLLKPTAVTDAGYRLYDDAALDRLKTVLMFRELGFALSDIADFLDNPSFDINEALREHIKLLRLRRAHIDSLIAEAEKMIKGESAGFEAFDTGEMDKFADEVKERWGKTEAYRQSVDKLRGKNDSQKKNMADGLMERFAAFGRIKNLAPDSAEATAEVKKLQEYIGANFYDCTNEILAGLGEMYAADGRFRENIDKAGGEGTAQFVSEAIKAYCG